MKHKKEKRDKKPAGEPARKILHGAVMTPEGPGVVVKHELRRNTNPTSGCWQYRVQLADGRVRHYTKDEVTKPDDV